MYNKFSLKIVFIILSFYVETALSESSERKNSLWHQVIQESKISGLGIVISHKDSSEIEYSLNENKFLTPASLSKIITASALYEYFTPSTSFETSFLSEAPVLREGVLNGNLYLKGGGDPSFVSETLWNLVNHLKRAGVRQVKGNLVVDEELFEFQTIKKRFSLDRSYNSPLSALSFNWNSVNIYIRPGLENQKAHIFIDPPNSYIQLYNKTLTQKGSRNLKVRRVKNKKGGDLLYVRGQIPLESSEFVIYRNVSNPAYFTGYNALEFLKQTGIHVEGEIQKGVSPQTAQVIAQVRGQTFFQLVQGMMKYSNNFIANMLTIQLALLKSQNSQKANVKEGLVWIRKFLNQKGFKGYQFVEPAGLSHKNKLTPRQIFQILEGDLKSPYSFEKLASYPLAQGNGTLKRRFLKFEPYSVRAKTGRLSGVEGLAGYVVNKKGERRIFVFLYNGSSKKQIQARNLFDKLIQILVEN